MKKNWSLFYSVLFFIFFLPVSQAFVLHEIPDYLRLGHIEYTPDGTGLLHPRHDDHPTGLLDYVISEDVKEALFSALDLEYPGLEEVKKAYEEERYSLAMEELEKYYFSRETPIYFPDSFPENRPDPDLEYDIEEARAVMEHSFNFSGITGNPGSPIDWDYKPNDYVEWNYALNRLYFLYPLILAYWHTHENIYGDYAVEDLADWMIRGPSQYDRVLEVSIRVATMLDTYFYLRDLETFSMDLHGLFLLRISEQGEYLKDNIPSGGWLSHWWYASLLFGRMFPEFQVSQELLLSAENIMEDYVDYNYYDDGYARTSSLMYHFFVETPHYIHLIDLYQINGWEVPGQERLQGIFSTYGQAHLPNYELPLFGDSEQRSPGLLRAYMLKIGELMDCDSMRYLGTEGEEGSPPEYTSVAALDSRLLFLRRDWSVNTPFLAINIGYGEGWHSHYDFLSFVYYINGRELLRDSGIRSYETEDRINFRSSKMHNVPEIEDVGQEDQNVYPPAERGEVELIHKSERFDLVQASLRYPEADNERVILTRSYFFLKEQDSLVLVDSFSDKDKQVTQYFQVGIEYGEVVPGTNEIQMMADDYSAYLQTTPHSQGITLYYGSENPFLGWYSELFHQVEPAHTMALHYYPPLPANIIFVFTGAHKRPDDVSVIQYDEEAGSWGIKMTYENRSYFMLQNPQPDSLRDISSFTLDGWYSFMVVDDGSIIELEGDGDLYFDSIPLEVGMTFPPVTKVKDFYLYY